MPSPLAFERGLDGDGDLTGVPIHSADRYHRAVELEDDLSAGRDVLAGRRDGEQLEGTLRGGDDTDREDPSQSGRAHVSGY